MRAEMEARLIKIISGIHTYRSDRYCPRHYVILIASQPDFPIIIIYVEGIGASTEITHGEILVSQRITSGTDYLRKRVHLKSERHRMIL